MRALIFAYLLAYLAFAIASPGFVRSILEREQVEAGLCVTDSECMRHCPPPADDPDCDGGPEGDLDREQARLCALDSAHCEER